VPVCATCGHEADAPFRFCPECGASAGAGEPVRERRKVVTVLFCDVTGSTALGERLDPEPLRALLARYFERMKTIVERHGGTVEKFIGDAVMAVFGVPHVHEDDALRAVRAAVQMRDALPELGLEARIGVMTGEVVTGTTERLATGDAVNVAARLEQGAEPGDVLIGGATFRLVRSAVEVEPSEPLELRGKSEPVAAYRLVSVGGEVERTATGPMVGRERQRRQLEDAFASVRADRACHLFTILGAAGVGKSRLAAEFLAGVDATVVRGRCLSYGEGSTYWPVVEILKQLGTRPDDDVAATAVASLLGESGEIATADQIAWAVRKTLEQAAADGPLVCVVDDLHWGEPVFLDLVEHIADWSRDAAILLFAMARPELLDRRPAWAGGKFNATTILLEPLSSAETDELIAALLVGVDIDPGLRRRIADAAEGNPLFVEEMLALVHESGDGEVVVPPTIYALLAARLDQLEAGERAVLERGAVEGKVFHRGAVQALAPDDPQVPARLMALVRKELVRPDRAQLPGDDAFRFRHLLIRDAAYDALPKATRAELHERFAAWLEARSAGLVERDEILGYHLEQAHRYRIELGRDDEHTRELGRRASDLLVDAGQRAHARNDRDAALTLLERALALLAPDERPIEVELKVLDLASARETPAETEKRAEHVVESRRAVGDARGEALARLHALWWRLVQDPQRRQNEFVQAVDDALREFEGSGDDHALLRIWEAKMMAEHARSRFGPDRLLAEQQIQRYARRVGDIVAERNAIGGMLMTERTGPVPLAEALRHLAEHEELLAIHPEWLTSKAQVVARLGRFDEARALVDESRRQMEERGFPRAAQMAAFAALEVELTAGDYAAAERHARFLCQRLEEQGAHGYLSTYACVLGLCLCRLGRYDEAFEWAERGRELSASDDALTQILWRQVEALVLARHGDVAAAEALAREAIGAGEGTYMVNTLGDALADLGAVLALAGKRDEAQQAYEKARALFADKGDVVLERRMEERLDELAALTRR
jgi:class 3 adenylate cyclase/tetratricopeptide (TPR) repeat protein